LFSQLNDFGTCYVTLIHPPSFVFAFLASFGRKNYFPRKSRRLNGCPGCFSLITEWGRGYGQQGDDLKLIFERKRLTSSRSQEPLTHLLIELPLYLYVEALYPDIGMIED